MRVPVRWFGLLAAVLLAACSGGDGLDARLAAPGSAQEGGSIPLGGPETGQALPTSTYERLDGGTVDFAAYRGKPLVVNVWASWCSPCLTEMPDFETVHQEVGDRVEFVGLNSRDDRTLAEDMADRTGVTYDLLYDPTASFVADVGVVAMPSTLFVDADGHVVGTKTGVLDADELRERVQELLAS